MAIIGKIIFCTLFLDIYGCSGGKDYTRVQKFCIKDMKISGCWESCTGRVNKKGRVYIYFMERH